MFTGGIDSERSFTDMIIGGCTPAALFDNVVRTNETLACEEAPGSVKGHKRNKNFTKDKDLMLVSAWLNMSLDPVHGANQPRLTYWKRIYDYFHSNNIRFRSNAKLPNELLVQYTA